MAVLDGAKLRLAVAVTIVRLKPDHLSIEQMIVKTRASLRQPTSPGESVHVNVPAAEMTLEDNVNCLMDDVDLKLAALRGAICALPKDSLTWNSIIDLPEHVVVLETMDFLYCLIKVDGDGDSDVAANAAMIALNTCMEELLGLSGMLRPGSTDAVMALLSPFFDWAGHPRLRPVCLWHLITTVSIARGGARRAVQDDAVVAMTILQEIVRSFNTAPSVRDLSCIPIEQLQQRLADLLLEAIVSERMQTEANTEWLEALRELHAHFEFSSCSSSLSGVLLSDLVLNRICVCGRSK